MARTIPAAVQTRLDNNLGEEIVVVLEIFWAERADTTVTGPGNRVWYADRDIPGVSYVKPKILNTGIVDAVVQILQGGQSKNVPIKLDDTEGDIKAVYNVTDIQKAPVRVWFYVMGTDFETEKFPIFLGQINSPVVWDEGERILDFQVVNRVEDVEVGFSAEEGAFRTLPEELIGKTWPLCFGTVENVPALKAVPAISGKLAGGVGIKDFTLGILIDLAGKISCPQTPIGFKCSGGGSQLIGNQICHIAFEQDQNCLQSRCLELERLKIDLEEQAQYEYTRIIIFGGFDFPQGDTITLNIGGGLFTGFFDGTPTDPSQDFVIRSRQHPRYDPATGTVIIDPVGLLLASRCPGDPSEDAQDSNWTDGFGGAVWTGLRNSRISWENYRRAAKADFFWAGGGSTVTLESDREIVYIANILPSTILSVKARRFLNGNEFLLTVPSEFFEIRQTDYTNYEVMEIVFQRPLSSESQDTGGGWSDEIFVSMTSSVGPNTVDIIRWFIETYTSYAIDDASFDDVKAKIDVYRMDFPLLTRPNLLSILQDLARKARCALWQRDDIFFIKYLAETPTPVATISEADILQTNAGRGTLKIELTSHNDLITKHTSLWRKDYAVDEPNKLILRHNVVKYGTHDQKEDYFPFRFLDIVRKSATFWLIRSANVWKRVVCSVPLKFTLLEPFDAVTVDLPDVASAPFLGVVERALLDSSGKQINLEIWTPIRAGEMTPYPFAFPANISENAIFPTIEAKEAGQAGSGTEPNFSTISPPGHPLSVSQFGVFSGFAIGCNGEGVTSLEPGVCRQDGGDLKPSDIGDTKPNPDIATDVTGKVSGSSSPISRGAGWGAGSTIQQFFNAQDKIEGDAGRAREVAESGGTGENPGSGDNNDNIDVPLDEDFLNDLPDPDDVKGCRYTVVVTGFNTQPSAAGVPPQDICIPILPSFTEIYVWDSAASASAFCSGLLGRPSCGGKPTCNSCISSCSIAASGDCDGSNDGDGDLIGYRPGGTGAIPFIIG